ncbi:MAG: hypothetical protein ACK5JT_11135 [Hyphomicrobiaceae bacterium]
MRWTEADFDGMSWHDNHVHGMDLRAGDHDEGELQLDLDHILEWVKGTDGCVAFRLTPAVLCFNAVSGLRVTIDFAGSSAAVGPFSIGQIERIVETGVRSSKPAWRILLNWPKGEICFRASGFHQWLTGEIRVCDRQVLDPHERS